MAKKIKNSPTHGLDESFTDITPVRDFGPYVELRAKERLTGREVQIVKISEAVRRDLAPNGLEDFLRLSSSASSLPHAAPLLRAELPPNEGVLLVYGQVGPSLADYFAVLSNRTFDRVTSVAIQLLALFERARDLSIIHGGLDVSQVEIDAAGSPSVRGFGLQNFAYGDGEVQPSPDDATPPESFSKGVSGTSADAYRLGSVLYVVCTGHKWTDGFENVVDAILNKEPIRFAPESAVAPLWPLVSSLLAKEPPARPTRFATLATEINSLRLEAELPAVLSGLAVIDDAVVKAGGESTDWSTSTPFSILLPDITLPVIDDSVEVATLDADNRSLSVRAVAAGKRPNVVSARRGVGIVDETIEKTKRDIESKESPVIHLEELRTDGGALTDKASIALDAILCSAGHRNEPDARFCSVCGLAVGAAPLPTARQCISGHPMTDIARFCGVCGQPSAGTPPLPATDPWEKKTSAPAPQPAPVALGTPPASESVPMPPLTDEAPILTGSPITPISPDVPPSASTEAPLTERAFCPVGHSNVISATFCGDCGRPMRRTDAPSIESTASLDTTLCPNGHPNRAIVRFCRQCAAPMPAAKEAVTPSSPASPESPVERTTPRPPEIPGLPGRPFLASATDPVPSGGVNVIFTQSDVAPAREETQVIRALAGRREIVLVHRREVVEGTRFSPVTAEETPVEPADTDD